MLPVRIATRRTQAEREIADTVMRELGRTFPYLEEHIKYGFPSEDDVVSMVEARDADGGVRCLYYGDYPSGNAMLLDGVRARYGHDLRSLVRFVGNAYIRPRRPTARGHGRPHHRAALRDRRPSYLKPISRNLTCGHSGGAGRAPIPH